MGETLNGADASASPVPFDAVRSVLFQSPGTSVFLVACGASLLVCLGAAAAAVLGTVTVCLLAALTAVGIGLAQARCKDGRTKRLWLAPLLAGFVGGVVLILVVAVGVRYLGLRGGAGNRARTALYARAPGSAEQAAPLARRATGGPAPAPVGAGDDAWLRQLRELSH